MDTMNELIKFIATYSIRGACTCGRCIDAPKNPEKHQPTGHTADVEFFKVSMKNNPDADVLKDLIHKNVKGEFCDIDLFDGNEYGYMQIGGWIGDQGTGLTLMGVGNLLGLWDLLTPTSMGMPQDMRKEMARLGMISIMCIK